MRFLESGSHVPRLRHGWADRAFDLLYDWLSHNRMAHTSRHWWTGLSGIRR